MATSPHQYLPTLCQLVLTKRPKSILDVGIGFGKNGLLCREYSELWMNGHNPNPADWQTRIVGIEAHEPYIRSWHREVYDEVQIGNALDLVPAAGEFDLIVCTDVLEHLEYAEAAEMLDCFQSQAKDFLVTTPDRFFEQGAVSGNEFERHRSFLPKALLRRYGTVRIERRTSILVGRGRSER